MEVGAHRVGDSINVGQPFGAEELLQDVPIVERVTHDLKVMDFQEFDMRGAEGGEGLLFMLRENRRHPVIRVRWRLSEPHLVLRGEDLRNRSPHEDDLVSDVY